MSIESLMRHSIAAPIQRDLVNPSSSHFSEEDCCRREISVIRLCEVKSDIYLG